MENLIKFLEDKITDKMSVEEIVDVFEQMCSTPLEEDMVLFETGTFTAFSKEPFFAGDSSGAEKSHHVPELPVGWCPPLFRDLYQSRPLSGPGGNGTLYPTDGGHFGTAGG